MLSLWLRKIFLSPIALGAYLIIAVALVPLALFWYWSDTWWKNATATMIFIVFAVASLVFVGLAFESNYLNTVGSLGALYILLMVLMLYGNDQSPSSPGNGEDCPIMTGGGS